LTYFTERTGNKGNFKVRAKNVEFRLKVMGRCEQKGEKVRGRWRKLYHKGIYKLHFLPNVKKGDEIQ